MPAMADLTACQRKKINATILLIISFCLVAHFLVEDVFLQGAGIRSYHSLSTAGLAFDEIEHQDDLVMTTNLPEAIQNSLPVAIYPMSVHLERKPAFPIRIPPKIA